MDNSAVVAALPVAEQPVRPPFRIPWRGAAVPTTRDDDGEFPLFRGNSMHYLKISEGKYTFVNEG